MPTTLVLLRHAQADPAPETGSDHERRLGARGLAQLRKTGPVWARRLPVPEAVLCSPARRTRDTLTAFLPDPVSPSVVHYPEALYLAPAGVLLEAVRATAAGTGCLLLVGHDDGISELALRLTDGAAPRLDTFAFVVLEAPAALDAWEPGCAEVRDAGTPP